VSRHDNRWGLVICALSVSLCVLAPQGQSQYKPSAPATEAAQSATTPNPRSETASPVAKSSTSPPMSEKIATDTAAQIDELIKQANEQMNVKGQFQKAAEFGQQAFDLSQKSGDKSRILAASMCLASAYYYEGRMPEALEMLEKVTALAKEVDNRKALSRALNRIAAVLGELGRFEQCLSYLYQAMDVAREQRDQSMQHLILINIGELYIRVGDPDKAEVPLLESLRIAHELKSNEPGDNPSKKATELSLKFLGEMEAAREHYKPALAYLQQVRMSRPESEQAIIGLLDTMAAIYQRIGEPQKAMELLAEARDRAKETGSVSYSITLADLGESQESLGQLNEALASEDLALAEVGKSGGNADYEWQIERHIGHIERGLGRDEEALTHYRDSIHAIELLRASALNTEPGRAGFTSRSQAVYAEMADLLVDLHRPNEALEIAEHGRARAFLDVLAQSRVGVADELTPDQRKQEAAILARVSSAQRKLWDQNASSDEKKKNDAELTAAESDLEKLHVQIRETNPHYADLQYPEPIHVQEIQSKLLDERTALIEYLLGEKRSLAWVVTKDKVTTTILPRRNDIEARVGAYRKLLGERVSVLTLEQSLTRINVVGGELYDWLFRPIEKDVRASKTLIIVPDGALGYLPFEALVTASARNAYLAQKFAIVYGPSASALVTVDAINRQIMQRRELLAFGDPVFTPATGLQKAVSEPPSSESVSKLHRPSPTDDYAERGFSLTRLPYTRDEVMGIGNLFRPDKRQLYLGADAREETVKSEKLDDFRYIHFATHGFLDELHPGRSGILLSRAPDSKEDGILQTGEIMRLKLNADIVTLSACSTGLGKLVNGEGVLGLTRAFFYAGARNVAVSLWNVNDSATATLMEHFYLNLRRGLPASEALRQAKLRLLHSSQASWRKPYFWAAFVIQGQGH